MGFPFPDKVSSRSARAISSSTGSSFGAGGLAATVAVRGGAGAVSGMGVSGVAFPAGSPASATGESFSGRVSSPAWNSLIIRVISGRSIPTCDGRSGSPPATGAISEAACMSRLDCSFVSAFSGFSSGPSGAKIMFPPLSFTATFCCSAASFFFAFLLGLQRLRELRQRDLHCCLIRHFKMRHQVTRLAVLRQIHHERKFRFCAHRLAVLRPAGECGGLRAASRHFHPQSHGLPVRIAARTLCAALPFPAWLRR